MRIEAFDRMTPADEAEAFAGMAEARGTAAYFDRRNAVVARWLPFVKWVIARRLPALLRSQWYDDHFQNGVLGLISAADRFDPSRGVGFWAFAEPHVYRRITRAVAHDRLIRLPAPTALTGRYEADRAAAAVDHDGGQAVALVLDRPASGPDPGDVARAARLEASFAAEAAARKAVRRKPGPKPGARRAKAERLQYACD